jgi:hypothetical protein
MFHKMHWELEPQRAGLGLATIKPDRFVALRAGNEAAELLTHGFNLPSNKVFVNAITGSKGWIRLEILDVDGKPVAGFTEADCTPVAGDSTAHAVHWKGTDAGNTIAGRPVRIRLKAKNADVFSIYSGEPDDLLTYHRFSAAWL